uniref:Ama1 protein n=1 Tax=Leishmania major TaxID=5664 RepID=Q9U5N9_LEIMA|nr:ama1 protein [Leishmania major]
MLQGQYDQKPNGGPSITSRRGPGRTSTPATRGVRRAAARVVRNRNGDWRFPLCVCCEDMDSCCEACCCFSCQVSRQCNMLVNNRREIHWPYWLAHDPCDVSLLFFSVTCVFASETRRLARERYGISGSGCDDCCIGYWCRTCSAQQVLLEMTAMSEFPGATCYEAAPQPAANRMSNRVSWQLSRARRGGVRALRKVVGSPWGGSWLAAVWALLDRSFTEEDAELGGGEAAVSGGGRAKQEEARQRASLTDDAVLSPPFVRTVILSLGPPALVDGEAIMWCPHFFCSLLLCASFTALILLTLSSPSCCLPLPFRLIPASPPSLPGAVAALEVLLLRLLSSPHRFFFLARPLPPVAPFPSPGPRAAALSLPPLPSPLTPTHRLRHRVYLLLIFRCIMRVLLSSPLIQPALSFRLLLSLSPCCCFALYEWGSTIPCVLFLSLVALRPVTMPATSVRGIRGPCPSHSLWGSRKPAAWPRVRRRTLGRRRAGVRWRCAGETCGRDDVCSASLRIASGDSANMCVRPTASLRWLRCGDVECHLVLGLRCMQWRCSGLSDAERCWSARLLGECADTGCRAFGVPGFPPSGVAGDTKRGGGVSVLVQEGTRRRCGPSRSESEVAAVAVWLCCNDPSRRMHFAFGWHM